MNVLQFALGLNIAQFAGNAKQAEDFLSHLSKSATNGGGALGSMASKLSQVFSSVKYASNSAGAGGLLGIAGAFGAGLGAVEAIKGVMMEVAGMARYVAEQFIHAADHAAQLYYQSARTNTSVGSLYGMQHAAQAVGLSAESPNTMVLKLQRALSGVSEEGQRTDQTFAALGLNMRELRKLAPEEQLVAVADALHDVNSAARAGYASNLFGRFGYGDMLQMTNQLDTWKRARADADPGGSLAAQTGAAFASARGSWIGLKADIEVFFMAIAKYLVVPFQEVIEALKAFPWRETGELIGLALEPFVMAVKNLANLVEILTNPFHFAKRKWDEVKSANADADAQPDGEQFKAKLWNTAGLLAREMLGIPMPLYGARHTGEGNPNDEGPQPWFTPRNNPFEKMGFVFNGGTDSATDYARRTAVATEKIAEHLMRPRAHSFGDYADVINMP